MNMIKRKRKTPLNLMQAFGTPDLNPLWESFWGDDFNMDVFNQKNWPNLEVKEDEQEYLVKAEVPGMGADDIRLEIENNTLEISGEKREETEETKKGKFFSEMSYGSFFRSVPFEKEVDAERVKAKLKDGVLRVHVAKAAPAAGSKRAIEITGN